VAGGSREERRGERARTDLTGVVLCGGKSRRMGRDKAGLNVGGRTLLERAVRLLDSISSRTLLACGPDARYAELGLPLALDVRPDGGPLAGLEAALAACETEYLAALACDMPRAEGRVFLRLHDRAVERNLDACLLETANGEEPLFAIYRRSCLDPIRAALESGERKVTSFLRFPKSDGTLPRFGSLREDELPSELAGVDLARNLNTPEELLLEIDAGGGR
jgi:molybdenum cofactor guanylyltransferase